MKFITTPTYKEIFGAPTPAFNDLVKGIPTKIIYGVASVINAELYLHLGNPIAQQKILNFLLYRQNNYIKSLVSQKILDRPNKATTGIAIFSPHLTLEFLHSALLCFHEDENYVDTNPSDDLAILKAYLVVSENASSRTQLTQDTSSPLDYFRKNTWPTYINQLEVNHPINYLSSLIKSKCFFDYLEFDSPYAKFVKQFLEDRGYINSWSYIINLAQIIQNSLTPQPVPNSPSTFFIKIDNGTYEWFDEMCLDVRGYALKFLNGKKNFDGFKDKPLIKFQSNVFFVIDWNLFANKIYNGLIYDFFKKSEISDQAEFKSKKNPFIAYKKQIGEFSVERYLFRKVISGTFKRKHTVLEFDDGKKQGFPDAYVRVGKRIFLFEIKDAFFPSETVESYDYGLIKSKIDEKYNSEKKGTSQLLKQITSLKDSPYEPRTYSELGLKTRNLVIYSILLFTDTFFSMPGVFLYLQEAFDEGVNQRRLRETFESIKPLSFFGIDFLIENLDLFQGKDDSLDKIIAYVASQLAIRRKNHEKFRSVEALFELNDTFEAIASKRIERIDKKSRDYTRTIFSELNLNRGMMQDTRQI